MPSIVNSGFHIHTLLKYVVIALGTNMLLRMVEARVREWYNHKNEYIKEIEARALNKKSLTIIFALVILIPLFASSKQGEGYSSCHRKGCTGSL